MRQLPGLLEWLMLDRRAQMTRPEVREPLIAQGFDPAGGSSAELAAFVKSEIADFAAVIKSAGLKAL